MTKPELKPCPFCGGEVFIGTWESRGAPMMYHIACFNDHCTIQPGTDYHKDKAVVIEDWNRRAEG